ncbi:hypothetical protein Lal_00033564, partial [Lupinus albus]
MLVVVRVIDENEDMWNKMVERLNNMVVVLANVEMEENEAQVLVFSILEMNVRMNDVKYSVASWSKGGEKLVFLHFLACKSGFHTIKILRLEAVSEELAKLPWTKPNAHQVK